MATPPSLIITLSLHPETYTYTSPIPPTLSLQLTSHASRPLTFFTWNTPLDPPSALTQAHYAITDVTTNTPVPQAMIRLQRVPISRARGSSDENYFLTLYPSTPVITSAGFSRGDGNKGPRPQPKEVVVKGWDVDGEGREIRVRRSTRGCGVDGLESGHTYRVDVKREAMEGIWWRWGEKEDFLVEEGSLDWNLSALKPEGMGVRVGEIEGVEFKIL